MKAKELREKNINELKRELEEKKEIVRQLRFDISLKQVKDHREIRNTKREIARLMTIIKERSE
ncbi:MAG: 50S ribosomal protein L29 [Candidatus Moranbacteria bacterium]|jgi:large subunit ribosomal protein L29|nr:50S ribosomal protein L29 [Candidatus Moranbacteria bacterium]MDD5652522.1 50S ribosomal protein L29 [Candidatus Moranbacteria bacterium]MDX9855637.1 50S ribosomal protein L29 [Candidatus Moranbacteria bacterium]